MSEAIFYGSLRISFANLSGSNTFLELSWQDYCVPEHSLLRFYSGRNIIKHQVLLGREFYGIAFGFCIFTESIHCASGFCCIWPTQIRIAGLLSTAVWFIVRTGTLSDHVLSSFAKILERCGNSRQYLLGLCFNNTR